MIAQILHSASAKDVCAGIGPDVRPVPAALAQTEIVDVLARANLKGVDQFMGRSIKCSLSPIGFYPHDQLFMVMEDAIRGVEKMRRSTPVAEHERDAAWQ